MPQPIGPTLISWNANTEPDLAGYFLYVGRGSFNYNDARSPVNVGMNNFTVFDVDAPGYWYFQAVAYNTSGQTSGLFGTELSDFFGTLGMPNFSGRNNALRGFVVG